MLMRKIMLWSDFSCIYIVYIKELSDYVYLFMMKQFMVNNILDGVIKKSKQKYGNIEIGL